MADNSSDAESDVECPFLLKLFYRTGSFHSPNEFASANHDPAYVPVYTFLTCTLRDLVYHLAAADENILPNPAIGTRVVFHLVYADTRAAVEGGGEGGRGAGPTRFVVRDLGSVVIGGGKAAPAAASVAKDSADDASFDGLVDNDGSGSDINDDGHKSLSQVRFFVGNYISCAILPPLPNGRVAPASHARHGDIGASSSIGEERLRAMPPQPSLSQPPSFPSGRGGSRGGWNGGGGSSRWHDGGRPPNRGNGGGSGNGVLVSDWRHGDRLPDGPAWTRRRPGRGGGGGGGRW